MFGSEKCERKKIGRKNEKKEKVQKININFFTYSVIYEKFKGGKFSFSFFWLTTKKEVEEKWKENKINNLS